MVLMSNISAYSNDVVVHSQIHTHTKAHWTHSSFSVYMYSLSTWNMHTFRRSFQRFIRFEYAMNQFDFNKLNTKWYSIFKLENCVLSNPLKFALLERIFSVKLTSLYSKFCRPYSSKPNFPECTFKWTFCLIFSSVSNTLPIRLSGMTVNYTFWFWIRLIALILFFWKSQIQQKQILIKKIQIFSSFI